MTAAPAGEYLFARMTRTEITRRAPGALAVLPLGATEQHGLHLPTGTDHLLVETIAARAAGVAAGRADVIVAPTIPYGFSAHHVGFGATVTISTGTLSGLLEEACTSLIACGFRHVFILNGHGGNEELIRVVARQVGTTSGAIVAASSYWVIAWDRLRSAGIDAIGRLPGHAGAFETSLLGAARPDVFIAQPPDRPAESPSRLRYHADVHVENVRAWQAGDGFSDNPARADAALGRRALDEIVGAVAEAFVAVAAEPDK